MSHHVVPVKIYFLIFGTLMVLTALTTAVAFVDLGSLTTVVALAIAVTKMTLVILFFMHVKYAEGLTKFVVVASFLWFAILIALALSDYSSRAWIADPQAWEKPAVSTTAP